MQRIRFSSFMLSFFLAFSLIPSPVVLGSETTLQTSGKVERYSGQERIATSIAVSQEGWSKSETVILNENSNYSDAISATPLAVQLNAPVLLTGGDKLDSRVITELKRLEAKKIILLGGTGRLKENIEKELKQLGYALERIGGSTRYDTSVLISEKVASDSMILVNGEDFPDSLSAASFAGIKNIPILLTSSGYLPESVQKYIQDKKPAHIIVVGGKSVVPDELLNKHGIQIETRLGGQNRYDTAASLYDYAKQAYSVNQIYLASGEQYPDAMVGTVLAAKNGTALLITQGNELSKPISKIFDLLPASSTIYILGGSAVVSDSIKARLEAQRVVVQPVEESILKGKTIVIDPGHGTPNPGAIGPSGTKEKDNNLTIAKLLTTDLEKAGAKVIMTRTNDYSPVYSPSSEYNQTADLQKRVDIAQQNGADLFISLHNDSWQTSYGTTTFYSSENPKADTSMKLAQFIQKELTQEIGTDDLGVKDSRFYVLRKNTMPAVLVEVAFISHPEEEKLLSNNEFRKKAAQGILKGIIEFVRSVKV